MTGLTYRVKPARVDPHLPFDCDPVGFKWRCGLQLIPKLARHDAEADYFVVSSIGGHALRVEWRFRKLFGTGW